MRGRTVLKSGDRKHSLKCLVILLVANLTFAAPAAPPSQTPVLVYHRFGAVVTDSMMVSTRVFESHLAMIKQGGYHVIPLRQLVDAILGGPPIPPDSIVITVDDGHQSVYTEMIPRLKQYGFPVTLFIYPSAISNAKWAMTWAQLTELQKNSAIDIQSHTFWHPNFKVEKKRLTETAYKEFVDRQLGHAKAVLEQKLAKKIDLLAWPFGIYDDWLMQEAQQAGYKAAFTLDRHPVRPGDKPLALARYLMTDSQGGSAFEKMLAQATGKVTR